MQKKIPVGILGVCGLVGQQYLHLLQAHPWFEVKFLASSEQSAGKSYVEALAGRWKMEAPLAASFRSLPVWGVKEVERAKEQCAFVFSAMSSEGARAFEEHYAAAGIPVISNAAYHREVCDIPVLIPEVNPSHVKMIPLQKQQRGWEKGFIVVKPNCSLQSYMIPLAPLHEKFRVTQLMLTTLQAVSGAGHAGVSSLDIADNVIPYIEEEEEKCEREPLKIWGQVGELGIVPATGIRVSAHCNRVPVTDGHLACVSVKFEKRPSEEEILELWRTFQGIPQQMKLPSAPPFPVLYQEEKNRPQPRRDRHLGAGMATSVGRLRPCPVFDYRFVALSHNVIRGAAGGGILNAEYLLQAGYL